MTSIQVCPECRQLFEYGIWHKGQEFCSLECRAEHAVAEAERQRDWERDELALRALEKGDE